MELFARRGFDGTTVKAIADRCQVTDPALYYHFSSKRQILDALWDEAWLRPGDPPLQPGRLSRQAIVHRMESAFYAWAEKPAFIALLYRKALEGDPTAVAYRRRVIERDRWALVPSLHAIYSDDAEPIADALVAVCTGIMMDTFLQYGSQLSEVIAQPSFRARLRRLFERALPEPCPPRPGLT